MFRYISHRFLIMIPTLLSISLIIFIIIQLPPGDYFETLLNEIESRGTSISEAQLDAMRKQYGFDKPLWQQYFLWVWGLIQGDLGWSLEHMRPVSSIVGDRL